jgi:hypothetical protein
MPSMTRTVAVRVWQGDVIVMVIVSVTRNRLGSQRCGSQNAAPPFASLTAGCGAQTGCTRQ